MGNYLETLKNINKSKSKKVENLIFIIVLLVVLLVSINYIFNSNKDTSTSNSNNTSSTENINSNTDDTQSQKSETEKKLADILSQISGISEASVMITYSQDSTQTPIYNTKEEQKGEDKTVEKNVAYNESGSSKTAIIESVQMPKVEGVIVVVKGANNVEMRSKIASAISAVTGVAVYKVQVFEKD